MDLITEFKILKKFDGILKDGSTNLPVRTRIV